MGMIRVSDEVEEHLKQLSDGRSMSATVEMLLRALENIAADESKKTNAGNWARLAQQMDARFDKLEQMILDTTIDRIDTPRGKGPVEISWGVMREVFFDFLKEHDQEWVADSVFVAIHEADAPEVSKYFAEDGHIYAQGPSGVKSVALVITPRLSSFLKEKGVLL